MPASYIPPKDADLDIFAANFSTLITATPAAYGLLAGDATTIAASVATWHTAYLLAVNPTTRTPATITAKDNARTSMLTVIRPYAQRIANNAGVSSMLKIGLGLNPRQNSPTPIPPPTTAPVVSIPSATPNTLVVRYRDEMASPSVKSKPPGALQCQIFGTVVNNGAALPTADLTMLPLIGTFNKSPFQIAYSPTNAGRVAFLVGRWLTRTGLPGPLGSPVNTTIMG